MSAARETLTLLASRQGGVVGRAQVSAAGIDRAVLSRLCRDGFLLPDGGGAYRIPALGVGQDTHLWRAVLATGGSLSHASAARLLGGQPQPSSVAVHVTVAAHRRPRASEGVIVHRSRRLPPTHTTRAAGLPHTIPPRTFVDLAATPELTDRQLVDHLDAWTTAGQMTMRWLSWFLANESQWLPGRIRAVALVRSLGDDRVDSAMERRLARVLRASGLAPFVTQHPITTATGTAVARVDFAWPQRQVALELDGYRFHSGPAVFADDRARGNRIELAGWLLLRTTPRELSEAPDRLLRSVRRALELRADPTPTPTPPPPTDRPPQYR